MRKKFARQGPVIFFNKTPAGVLEGGCSATITLKHELPFYKKTSLTEEQKSNFSPEGHVESCRQKLETENNQISLNLDGGRRFGSKSTYQDSLDRQGDNSTVDSCR